MKKYVCSKTYLFFIEVMIGILFFALSTAIISKAFVKADDLREKGINLTKAIMKGQSVASCFRASSDEASFSDNLEKAGMIFVEEDNTYYVYYNKDWKNVVTKEESTYIQKITLTEIDVGSSLFRTFKMDITVGGKNKIWELSLRQYGGNNG